MPGLPPRMRERAAAVVAGDPSWVPPVPRDAATVALLRDGVDGVEVFLMRRQPSMAFAAGMHVYPGGAVEQSDSHVPIAGPADLDAVGRALSTDDPAAVLVAAARETFEECGVLLAVTADGGGVVVDDALAAARTDLDAGRIGFGEVLLARGLVVDAAALVPLDHWVTPEVEDRRYDTRFLVAALPASQEAHDLGGESDRTAWWRPGDALTAWREGRMPMLPPTSSTLALIAEHHDVGAVLAAVRGRTIVPLLPHPYAGPDGEVAWHLVHERTRAVVLAAGEPAGSETDGASGGQP